MTRIQRRRTPAWRMPEGAIYVGRPSKWGNREDVGDDGGDPAVRAAVVVLLYAEGVRRALRVEGTAAFDTWLAPLAGHDLVCWCPRGLPCHADVLLELLGGPAIADA